MLMLCRTLYARRPPVHSVSSVSDSPLGGGSHAVFAEDLCSRDAHWVGIGLYRCCRLWRWLGIDHTALKDSAGVSC